jgi:hypothetical protein
LSVHKKLKKQKTSADAFNDSIPAYAEVQKNKYLTSDTIGITLIFVKKNPGE